MRWLIHGTFTPAVKEALVRHGHTAETVGEVVADSGADQNELIALIRRTQRDLLTNDKDFVQRLLDRPTKLDRSVVHLQLAGGDVEQDDAIDRLFVRYKRLKPGMLYTVTETRVKVRQLPTGLAPSREE
ncbi:MAG: hypothetical protein JWM57_3971 [Phycisphaerales bacterium]|nr:hypothetical protein [Phycisphaerales bacterium]